MGPTSVGPVSSCTGIANPVWATTPIEIRNSGGNPAPSPIIVDDLPAIVAELRRILAAVETAQGNMRAYERDFLRDVVRRGHRNISGEGLLPVDLDFDQEKALPAHFELAIEKL